MIESHKINSEIIFESYSVNLINENGTIIAEGEVTSAQKFQPRPNFVFSGKLELRAQVDMLFPIHSQCKCEFIDLKKVVDVILINTHLELGGDVSAREISVSFIISQPPLAVAKAKKLKYLKFNIINFNKELNKAQIEFDEWALKIEKIASQKDYEQLESVNGYLVTHKGEITKKDNSEFDVNKAELLSNFLYKLFSFCKGVTTSTFFMEGFNSNGDLVWYQLDSGALYTWTDCNNWFSESRIDLNNFVEGFFKFCQTDPFKEHINEILYWYITVNGSLNNYSGVIISHTALELISWIYLTEDKKVLSANGYNNIPAGDCLALTLGYSNIPINLPSELSNLVKLGKSNNLNAPLLFSTVRNKIVHPPSKRRDQFTNGRTIFEAKLLGLWFLELFILSKSNYKGDYVSRLNYSGRKGDTESVPYLAS